MITTFEHKFLSKSTLGLPQHYKSKALPSNYYSSNQTRKLSSFDKKLKAHVQFSVTPHHSRKDVQTSNAYIE